MTPSKSEPAGLELPGTFKKLNDIADSPRTRTALWGSGGSGKTRFIMSATRPLIYLGFDRPLEPKTWAGEGFDVEDVYVYDFSSRLEAPKIVIEDVRRVIRDAADQRVGTLAIDNGKVYWDLITEALKDSNYRKGAMVYGEPNAFMKETFTTGGGNPAGLSSEMNFIITYPAADEWTTRPDPNNPDKTITDRSGRYVPAWWNKTEYGVDAVLWLYRWPTLGAMAVPPQPPSPDVKRSGVTYWARPSKFLGDPELVGADIEDPSFDKMWFNAFGEHAKHGAFRGKK